MSQRPIDLVLSRLPSNKHSGPNQWTARCPAHDDHTPSLQVGISAKDDKVLLSCRAGCLFEVVVDALGLNQADLFVAGAKPKPTILREFPYTDADGVTLYIVRRIRRLNGSLDWTMGHAADNGSWVPNVKGIEPVLYGLPRILGTADDERIPVWVTEGERDADSLTSMHLVATTVRSHRWTGVDLTPLRGRLVNVVVDNDTAGWKNGARAIEALTDAGAIVSRTYAPAPGNKDVTEHLNNGASIDVLRVVDLDVDQPEVDKWASPVEPIPQRSSFTDDGKRAVYRLTPSGHLLGLSQAGLIRDVDWKIWALLDQRAGKSGIAQLTIDDIAKLTGCNRNSASRSIKRLTNVGLIAKDKRGHFKVSNPAYPKSVGTVTPVLFSERTTNPPSPTNPHNEPSERAPNRAFAEPKSSIRPDLNALRIEHSDSATDSDAAFVELIKGAFPGAST